MKLPTAIGATCIILAACALMYFSAAKTLLAKRDTAEENKQNKAGYWGETTAEFDWCENNYVVSEFIAEPWNTATSLVYTAMAIGVFPYYIRMGRAHGVNMKMYLRHLLPMFAMGFSSAAFHTTLQYEHQMMDKITMLFLAASSFAVMYSRGDHQSWAHLLSFAQSLAVTVVFWCSRADRPGLLHQGMRVVWFVSFVLFFCYQIVAGTRLVKQCGRRCEQLMDWCFLIWAFSLIGWICDTLLCDQLARYNIPYLNYHGTVWHFGGSLGTHYIYHVAMACGLIMEQKQQIEIRYHFGIFPLISIVGPTKIE